MTTDADARSFIKAISSPVVRPFISWEKVVKSEQFSSLIRYYDDHFDRYRDTGHYERVLAFLDGTKYRDMLANYLRVRHGVHVSRENGKLKVSVVKAAGAAAYTNKDRTFAQFFSNPESVVRAKPPKKTNSGRPLFKKDYVDALDHPARLPGSFGHGRRR